MPFVYPPIDCKTERSRLNWALRKRYLMFLEEKETSARIGDDITLDAFRDWQINTLYPAQDSIGVVVEQMKGMAVKSEYLVDAPSNWVCSKSDYDGEKITEPESFAYDEKHDKYVHPGSKAVYYIQLAEANRDERGIMPEVIEDALTNALEVCELDPFWDKEIAK